MAWAVAIVSAALSLAGACFTMLLTAPWRRLDLRTLGRELDDCRTERAILRGRLEVLQQALLGLLPKEHRLALLEQLDRVTPPFTDDLAA